MAVIQYTFDPNAKPNESRGDFTPTPEGVHDFKVVSAEMQAPKAGKEYGELAIKYEVVQSPDATAIGRSRTFWLKMTPKATPYFLTPFLQASGIQFQSGQIQTAAGLVPAISFDTDHLVGAIIRGKCSHEQGQNDKTKVYETWSDFSVSPLNPLLAGQAAAPAMQPAPAQAASIPQAVQQVAQGFMPAPTAGGFVPQQQAPGQIPPRRFG